MVPQLKIDQARFDAAPQEVQDEIIRSLVELDELIDKNPLQVFEPKYQQQTDFLAAGRVGTKMFAGGNQAGKTTIGLADDLIQAVDRDCLPEHLLQFKFWEPPFLCRIVTPDFTSTMQGVIYEKLKELAPVEQLLGGSWDKAYDKANRKLRFENGSSIDFLTFEQEVDKFGGVTLDRVHLDEEPPGEKGQRIYQQCCNRVIRRGGQVMFTMTPLFGLSWVKAEVWDHRHEEDFFATKASMLDNPTLPREEIEKRTGNLSKEEFASIVEGGFSHFAGKVFDEFTEDKHVCDPPTKEHVKDLEVLVGIDPSLTRTGVVWVGFDSDNHALVFDEIAMSGSTVEQICAEIGKRNKRWGVEPVFNVIDPAARNRALVNAEQVEAEFARHGVYCVHGQNAREPGINIMKRRLQADPPTLMVSRELSELPQEFEMYRKDPRSDGAYDVVKVFDDCLDALRYVLMTKAWELGEVPKARSRSFDESWPPQFNPSGPPVSPPTGALT